MSDINVSVDGFDRLMRQLKTVSNPTSVLQHSFTQSMAQIQAQAKLLAPVDTGMLRNSIKTKTLVQGQSVKGVIFSNCSYAPYLEFGTGKVGQSSPCESRQYVSVSYRQTSWIYTPDGQHFYKTDGQKAQPYMYPAIKMGFDVLKRNLERDIQTAIRSV